MTSLRDGWLYEGEQAACDVLPDEVIVFGFGQPACAGSLGAPLDPHHVVDCLGDGVQVADYGDQFVAACLGSQDCQEAGEHIGVQGRESFVEEQRAERSAGAAVHLDQGKGQGQRGEECLPSGKGLGAADCPAAAADDLEFAGEPELAAGQAAEDLACGAEQREGARRSALPLPKDLK